MILLLVILLLCELLYFKLADRYGIIDKPNKRSSHDYITRRGGGVIFPLAWLFYSIVNEFAMPWFTLGLLIVSVVSFIDDIREVGVKTRLTAHVVGLTLAFHELGITEILPWWSVALCFVGCMAAINAINFMDGINGITGLYSMVFWISAALFSSGFDSIGFFNFDSPYPFIMAALLIFGFFNFRKRASCFAGDVGSVSMAYLMIGASLVMIFRIPDAHFGLHQPVSDLNFNGAYAWPFLLMLTVYGADSLLTIVHRLFLGENLLKGHRRHLYQNLVNEFQWPHLVVASIYAGVQLLINSWVMNNHIAIDTMLIFLTATALIYAALKFYVVRSTTPQPSVQVADTTPPALSLIAELTSEEPHQDALNDVIQNRAAHRRRVYESNVTTQSVPETQNQ